MTPMKRFCLLLLCSFSVAAAAAAAPELPKNTLQCDGFKKMPDGSWFALATNPPFDLASSTQITIATSRIVPRMVVIDGYDLYDVLEKKCSGQAM